MRIRLATIMCFFGLVFVAVSCSESEAYTDVPASSVVCDLSQVPYPKLSDYHFFEGAIKNLNPSQGVIAYKPASELFTDYAQKKRFVWMPNGTKATYTSDSEVLNLPVGAALIKVFYYTTIQPGNQTKIIETRIMIRKNEGWIFANYVWNDEQTDAFLTTPSTTREITFANGSEVVTIDYRTPESDFECLRCHGSMNGTIKEPLGIKPQNINYSIPYNDGTKNQLIKLAEEGYLDAATIPASIVSTVDYKDSSQSVNLRVRSYFDSNCAHCHKPGGEAQAHSLRFAFSETINPLKMGVNAHAMHYVPGYNSIVVTPGNVSQSILYYRLHTETDLLYIMPPLGRTKRHTEALQLIENWITNY